MDLLENNRTCRKNFRENDYVQFPWSRGCEGACLKPSQMRPRSGEYLCDDDSQSLAYVTLNGFATDVPHYFSFIVAREKLERRPILQLGKTQADPNKNYLVCSCV